MLIDTHAHLNFPDYKDDLEKVINRSLEKGVKKIICVSSNLTDSSKAIDISKEHPSIVYAAVGIHPHQTNPQEKLSIKKQIEKLKELAKKKGVVAIGECGLDLSPAPPMEKDRPEKEQIFLFKEQIKIALSSNLPILVHSRKAFPQVMAILKERHQGSKGQLKGVLHCFSAGRKAIKQVEEIGFCFGVDGNLTYDFGLQNVVKEIPLEKILLETDCPFLSPEPYRGLRNEPKNVRIIAESLAQIKEVAFEKIARITTQNAQNLLKI